MTGVIAVPIAAFAFSLLDDLETYSDLMLTPVKRVADALDPSSSHPASEIAVCMSEILVFAVPQVVLAFFGGWAARRMGIRIVRGKRRGAVIPADARPVAGPPR